MEQLHGNTPSPLQNTCAGYLCSSVAHICNQNTIPERVAEHKGKPVVIRLMRDSEPKSLADLTNCADLIVYGKLVRQKTYLTTAQTALYTDYELRAERVIVDRVGPLTAKSPGPTPPLTVTILRGN
jgi:hypothetical protein